MFGWKGSEQGVRQQKAVGFPITRETPPLTSLHFLTSLEEAEHVERRVDTEQYDGDAADDEHSVERAAAVDARDCLGLAQVGSVRSRAKS
jgi:hypothetical protein